jgi:hypothetical protein
MTNNLEQIRTHLEALEENIKAVSGHSNHFHNKMFVIDDLLRRAQSELPSKGYVLNDEEKKAFRLVRECVLQALQEDMRLALSTDI